MTQRITINGRSITIRPDMTARELRQLAGIDRKRLLLGERADGRLVVLPDHAPLPGPRLIDAPRFIYG